MTDFIEELKSRAADALERLQATQKEVQVAQAKLQAVAQEHNSLQFLLHSESAKLQQQNNPPDGASPVAVNHQTGDAPTSDLNKTDMIRALLQQHPNGMTAPEIWKEIKAQLSHRAYLYSILKRLRDRDEVFLRRKKYVARIVPKPQEVGGQTTVQ